MTRLFPQLGRNHPKKHTRVAMGLESVVESWVSVLEHHNNPRRALSQERLEQKAMVAINGPAEVHVCIKQNYKLYRVAWLATH